MPLITLTTKPSWHPTSGVQYADLDPQPRQVVDFGRELPVIMLRNSDKLFLSPETTPVTVQVNHRPANTHDVNAPDLWIEIRFTETELTEVYRTSATYELKRLVHGWFWEYMHDETDTPAHLLARFDVACDVYWPNGHHGFLSIGGLDQDW